MSWQQRVRWIAVPALVTLGIAVTILCALLLVGAVRDDLAIGSHPGRAAADVLSVSPQRTVVRFIARDGSVHTPPQGVLYPDRLDVGDKVWVQYDTTNPELVKVAGRGFKLALLPLGSVLVVTWLVIGTLLLWLRARWPAPPPRRRASTVTASPPAAGVETDTPRRAPGADTASSTAR